MRRCTQYLSMGVDKGEGSALAAEVDKGRSCFQVLRQTQCGGAGGKQSDRKEVHLGNCLDSPFSLWLWLWSGVSGVATGIGFILTVWGLPKRVISSSLVSQVFPRVLGSLRRRCSEAFARCTYFGLLITTDL